MGFFSDPLALPLLSVLFSGGFDEKISARCPRSNMKMKYEREE
jgi:hypothetical protein